MEDQSSLGTQEGLRRRAQEVTSGISSKMFKDIEKEYHPLDEENTAFQLKITIPTWALTVDQGMGDEPQYFLSLESLISTANALAHSHATESWAGLRPDDMDGKVNKAVAHGVLGSEPRPSRADTDLLQNGHWQHFPEENFTDTPYPALSIKVAPVVNDESRCPGPPECECHRWSPKQSADRLTPVETRTQDHGHESERRTDDRDRNRRTRPREHQEWDVPDDEDSELEQARQRSLEEVNSDDELTEALLMSSLMAEAEDRERREEAETLELSRLETAEEEAEIIRALELSRIEADGGDFDDWREELQVAEALELSEMLEQSLNEAGEIDCGLREAVQRSFEEADEVNSGPRDAFQRSSNVVEEDDPDSRPRHRRRRRRRRSRSPR